MIFSRCIFSLLLLIAFGIAIAFLTDRSDDNICLSKIQQIVLNVIIELLLIIEALLFLIFMFYLGFILLAVENL